MISADDAKKMISYNPITGKFIWISGRQSLIGEQAGTLNQKGYRAIGLAGNRYQAHRLAFFLMNGEMPKGHVDHINGDRDDNRWGNLRDIPLHENYKNKRIGKNNKTGIMGVRWCARKAKWIATIYKNKKPCFLGGFRNFFEACCARKSAENLYGYHENHGAR